MMAKEVGLKTPNTLVTNNFKFLNNSLDKDYAVKTLDTVIIHKKKSQGFIYTNISKGKELKNKDISTAPVILQKALLPKVDIRVTVVENFIHSVAINSDRDIREDWRIYKSKLQYKSLRLPAPILTKCKRLVKKLNLKFGAIDLIKYNNSYYFIEINPTGEWSWLLNTSGCDLDYRIARCLSR